MGIFMISENEKDIERLVSHQDAIDDLYYEVFRLLQDELQNVVDKYPDAVPTEHIIGILQATDLFYSKNYGTKEGTDRAGEGEL